MPTEENPNPSTTDAPAPAPAPAPRGPLTDEELMGLHPDVALLVLKLEQIGQDAIYLSDPRQGVQQLARAIVKYFRTPDAL